MTSSTDIGSLLKAQIESEVKSAVNENLERIVEALADRVFAEVDKRVAKGMVPLNERLARIEGAQDALRSVLRSRPGADE